MARQEHVLSVFVASPSDVDVERGKLEDVIRELNVTWSRELGIRLDLVRWETHAYPGSGDDAQDVINEQIPDDYDVFVGIMWCRYGTPTGRAGSGTVEEFDRAKARYDIDPKSVQLMFYFKDEPLPPSRLDPDQLSKVNAFRSSLGAEGVLYWNFSGIEQFEKLIRLHLTRQVQTWKNRRDSVCVGDTNVVETAASTAEIDDEGILDLMEIFEEKFAELGEILNRIGSATQEIGERMSERTAEMEALPRDSKGNANRKDAKRLIARAATDMTQYAARIEADLPLFRDAMNTGMNAFIKAASMSREFTATKKGGQDTRDGLEAIVALRGVLATTKDSMTGFRQSVDGLPRMTSDLNKAKRRAKNALDDLMVELRNSDSLLAESEKVVRGLLADNANGG